MSRVMSRMSPSPRNAVTLAVILVVVVLAAVAVLLLVQWRRSRQEPFFGAIVRVATSLVTGIATGQVNNAINKGSGGGGGNNNNNNNQRPAYQVTYSGRQWDGADWSCPWWSVETGSTDNSKACITSQYHSPVWKWTGKEWGWACANGTVPTNDAVWEKKCEVGWTARVLDGGKWKCPWGAEDTGKNWQNSTWEEAHKQCRRNRPYTLRVNQDNKWVCPTGSTDTKRNWGDKNEWDQCKWTGP